MTSVEQLVDGGDQHARDWRPPISVSSCGRERCKGRAAAGFSFCAACLAWLRRASAVDPLDDGPELAKMQAPTPPQAAEWRAYVEMLREGGTTV